MGDRTREVLTWIAGRQDSGKDRRPNIRCDERGNHDRKKFGERCGEEATTVVVMEGMGRLLVCDRCSASYHTTKEPLDWKNVGHLRVMLAQISEDAAAALK